MAIVGGGPAGLITAVAVRRACPGASVKVGKAAHTHINICKNV